MHQVRLFNTLITKLQTNTSCIFIDGNMGIKGNFLCGSFGAMLPLCLIGAVQESALFPDLIRFVEFGIVLCGC